MYGDNTVSAAGQAGAGSTANIVFSESNPQVLQQKLDFMRQQKESLMQSSEQVASDIENQRLQDQQAIEAAANEENTLQKVSKTSKSLFDMGDKISGGKLGESLKGFGQKYLVKEQRLYQQLGLILHQKLLV